LERVWKLDSGGGGPTNGGGNGDGGSGDGKGKPQIRFEFLKPSRAVVALEAFDHTAEQLQQRLSGQELRGYGCLDKYRADIASAVSSFQVPQAGTRLVACYLLDVVDADFPTPIAIYRISVNFKGRRGIDVCTIEDVVYRPGVAKGDHVSESVSLSRKGARYVRRFGFDGLRVWIMKERGWLLEEETGPKHPW
jgi:hypothetical protein